MEKRLLLAFAISFGIISIWSIYFSPKTNKNTEIIDSKQFTSESVIAKIENSQPENISSAINSYKENIELLENENLILKFSDLGGKLKEINLKNYDYSFPTINIASIKNYDKTAFKLKSKSKNTIVYYLEDNDLIVENTYTVESNHTIRAAFQIKNKLNSKKILNFDINAIMLEMSKLDIKSIDKSYNEYIFYSGHDFIRKNNAFEFLDKEKKTIIGSAAWAAFRNRYFCLIVKPEYTINEYRINPINNKTLSLDFGSKGIEISAGGDVSFNYTIYAGPETSKILNSYDKDFSKIKMFYRFGFFDAVAKFLYTTLHFLQQYVKNWGLSIVLICIGIYLALYPLTLSSMSSMKKMQALQPKIKEIQEKYKNNQQRQSTEMMQLYKENRINPLGGCLPLLLQMPFFIGIYQVLWRDVSFKDANFLWIKDLAAPDRLITLPFNMFFIGNEINILPVVYAIAMFIQQKFSSKTMVSADPTQAEVQKMMTFIMPIMLAVLFYKFPSGITLYFTTYFLLTAFTQWKMSKI